MTHCSICPHFTPETDQDKIDTGLGGYCSDVKFTPENGKEMFMKIPVHVIESESKSMFCPEED